MKLSEAIRSGHGVVRQLRGQWVLKYDSDSPAGCALTVAMAASDIQEETLKAREEVLLRLYPILTYVPDDTESAFRCKCTVRDGIIMMNDLSTFHYNLAQIADKVREWEIEYEIKKMSFDTCIVEEVDEEVERILESV